MSKKFVSIWILIAAWCRIRKICRELGVSKMELCRSLATENGELFLREMISRSLQKNEAQPQAGAKPRWWIEQGIICFTLEANGWTANEWRSWFGDNQSKLSYDLLGCNFQPTPIGTIIQGFIFPGKLFPDSERRTKNILEKAGEQSTSETVPDIVLLVVKAFGQKEIRKMGLSWLIGMHQPIQDSAHTRRLLGVNARSEALQLHGYDGSPCNEWDPNCGFVFGCFAS